MRGPDPRIHAAFTQCMDYRVKPGNDGSEDHSAGFAAASALAAARRSTIRTDQIEPS
jgi:hypothetical protein